MPFIKIRQRVEKTHHSKVFGDTITHEYETAYINAYAIRGFTDSGDLCLITMQDGERIWADTTANDLGAAIDRICSAAASPASGYPYQLPQEDAFR